MHLFIRLVKYNLNLLGLFWIIFITELSYGLNTGNPGCEQLPEIIFFHLPILAKCYLLFLVCATGMNYLIEWKIERKKQPKEFLTLLFIHLVLILVIAFLISKEYYDSHCP